MDTRKFKIVERPPFWCFKDDITWEWSEADHDGMRSPVELQEFIYRLFQEAESFLCDAEPRSVKAMDNPKYFTVLDNVLFLNFKIMDITAGTLAMRVHYPFAKLTNPVRSDSDRFNTGIYHSRKLKNFPLYSDKKSQAMLVAEEIRNVITQFQYSETRHHEVFIGYTNKTINHCKNRILSPRWLECRKITMGDRSLLGNLFGWMTTEYEWRILNSMEPEQMGSSSLDMELDFETFVKFATELKSGRTVSEWGRPPSRSHRGEGAFGYDNKKEQHFRGNYYPDYPNY